MMQKILFVIHAAPYGSERCRSALRAALSLADRDQQAQVRLFLMSDATTLALPNQETGGESLLPMLQDLLARNVPVKLCRTCAQARGLLGLTLLAGCEIGTLDDLSDWTLESDKVLVF